jgi:hypothetical protein
LTTNIIIIPIEALYSMMTLENPYTK